MILNRMKILYIYLIKYMIIVGFIVQCIQPAFAAATKKRVHVTEPPKQITVNASHLEEGKGNSTENKYNYKVFIIALIVMVLIGLPGAAVWFLYYRLKKKNAINDIEKATEESQAKPTISRITSWLTENCPLAFIRHLYHKLRKRKPIDDEEKAIEKSQPKPSTTLRSKDKKKKKKKKKNAPVNKPMEEATEAPLTKQCTDDTVQSDQGPRPLSMPKENVGITSVIQSAEQEHEESASVSLPPIIPEVSKPAVENEKETCSKVKYKRIIVLTWIEEITDDEDDEESTHQIKECQKEIPVALEPKMREVTEPKKDPQLPVSTVKPKTTPDGLKASKKLKKTVKHEATDIKPKPEIPIQDKLPVFLECQELPKPNCASQVLKDMMRNHLGTEKDLDPETEWKRILKGNGKGYQQKLESKVKISPMLAKELQENFQKHRASKTAICTGVGSSDALLAHPEEIPGAYRTTLARTYIAPRDKPIVSREMLQQTIEDRQSTRTQNQHEVTHVATPVSSPQQQMEEPNIGTHKDLDPETEWKSILKGNGKGYQQKLESKVKISPMLAKELQENFQKHRASKTAICTGAGSCSSASIPGRET
eukprot:XP_012816900.1 PREDICTED: uncharacterized protein LOC100497735 [Xenopus tropicalis]